MSLNTNEIFLFIDALIAALKDRGEDAWAQELRDATLISFMPGELFREIRRVLRKFERTHFPKDLNIKDELKRVLSSLDYLIDRG